MKRDNMPRTINAIVAVWLFISAFVWPHSPAQLNNTWILGVLCFAFSMAASSNERLRYVNTVLAIWLFISAWALPSVSPGTVWNNVIVSIVVFLVSLIPSSSGRPLHPHTV